jgi:DNA-binding NarL/FixJ family response regulator
MAGDFDGEVMGKIAFPRKLEPLTRHSRELRAQILAMLKKGKSQNAIARELDKSLGTIGYHVSRLRMAGKLKR